MIRKKHLLRMGVCLCLCLFTYISTWGDEVSFNPVTITSENDYFSLTNNGMENVTDSNAGIKGKNSSFTISSKNGELISKILLNTSAENRYFTTNTTSERTNSGKEHTYTFSTPCTSVTFTAPSSSTTIYSITITYTTGSGGGSTTPEAVDLTLALSETEITATVGDTPPAWPSLSVKGKDNTELDVSAYTVTFSFTGDNVVDTDSRQILTTTTGTATVTATVTPTDTETYKETTTSFNVTINEKATSGGTVKTENILTNSGSTKQSSDGFISVSGTQEDSGHFTLKQSTPDYFTVSATGNAKILKVVINYTELGRAPEKEGALTVEPATGTFVYNTTSTSSTWTGCETSLKFTDDPTNGNDMRVQSIDVTYSTLPAPILTLSTTSLSGKEGTSITKSSLPVVTIGSKDDAGNDIPAETSFEFQHTSLSPDIADFDSEGNLVLKAGGTATIQVSTIATEAYLSGKASYTVTVIPIITPSNPTFSKSGGRVMAGTYVTISCTTEGSTIYFTTNGEDPITSANRTEGTSFTVNDDMTVKAVAYYAPDNQYSSVVEAVFTIVSDVESTLSAYDENRPVGWGENVTGSGYKGFCSGTPVNPILVTNSKELTAALQGDTPRTIYVQGNIYYAGADTINGGKNKTVIGLQGARLISDLEGEALEKGMDVNKTGILCFAWCDNIIIRNLEFIGPGSVDVSGKDNLTFHGSTNMWVDHCTIRDGIDGNFDIIHGSDNIAVTWCKFTYTNYAEHNTSNLVGHDDWNYVEDEGHLNVTWGNCWWDANIKERTPRVRYGKNHIYNSYMSDDSQRASEIQAGFESKIFADYNRLTQNVKTENSQRKLFNSTDEKCDTYYYSYKLENNNVYNGSGNSGGVEYFTPTYSYLKITDTANLESIITNSSNGAGNTLIPTLPDTYDTYIEPSITIGAGKQWATYASAYDLDFTESGCKAYTISSYTSNDESRIYTLSLDEINKVPAGTGVVINGNAGTYYPKVTTEGTSIVSGNMLVGTITPTWIGLEHEIEAADKDVNPSTPYNDLLYKDADQDPSNGIQRCDGGVKDDDYYDYILSNGVFKYALNGRIAANKAYLHLPKVLRDSSSAGASAAYTMVIGDATGIETIENGVSNSEIFDNNWYTLQGIRTDRPAKPGIYVRNGKKVIIK